MFPPVRRGGQRRNVARVSEDGLRGHMRTRVSRVGFYLLCTLMSPVNLAGPIWVGKLFAAGRSGVSATAQGPLSARFSEHNFGTRHDALEVAVDQRLHCRQQQRRPKPADDRPEDDDRGQALRQRHRQRADRVGQQPQHVRPLAPDQVADLAADQDECRRDQRLQRDRRLHPADGRVQVLHHRRDRHVHQRGVDHQHEHRHRQQDGEPLVAGLLLGDAGRRVHPMKRLCLEGFVFGLVDGAAVE